MKNIAYIISQVNKSLAFEWIAQELDTSRFRLVFILLNNGDSALERFLLGRGITVHRVPYHGKKDLLSAILRIRSILKREKTGTVHCHLFEASLAGLIAARIAGIPKRIHTRHNSTIHHDYHPQAVKYDRLINYLSTDIIAVSENVKNVLVKMENADPEKIRVIQHGFRLDEAENIPDTRIEQLKQKYRSEKKHPVIGVISRYIEWKGVQYIIPAFGDLLKEYPEAHLLLANAGGPYLSEIRSLLAGLPAGSYTEIPFEEDVFALYRLFDVFVHTPVDDKSEAFGQVYVEALASGIPSVFTRSGVAAEFITDRENALLVPFRDTAAIHKSLLELIGHKELRQHLAAKGKQDVRKDFELQGMIRKLEDLYER